MFATIVSIGNLPGATQPDPGEANSLMPVLKGELTSRSPVTGETGASETQLSPKPVYKCRPWLPYSPVISGQGAAGWVPSWGVRKHSCPNRNNLKVARSVPAGSRFASRCPGKQVERGRAVVSSYLVPHPEVHLGRHCRGWCLPPAIPILPWNTDPQCPSTHTWLS